jgi:CheY-like chemotaxis protein
LNFTLSRLFEIVSPNLLSERSELTMELRTTIRVLVAESDAVSRRVISSILEREADVSLRCIDNSDVVGAIQDFSPDLMIVDTQNPAIRRAANWEALGVKSPSATILTSYDKTSLMPFAPSSTDLLIKPFNVEEFENAMEVAHSKIANARAKLNELGENNHNVHGGQPKFLQRFAAELEGNIVLIKVPEKSFAIPRWESANFSVGARFFNFFNHPNFGFPNTNIDSKQFGQITSAVSQPTTIYGSGLQADASPRVIEMQAKFVF